MVVISYYSHLSLSLSLSMCVSLSLFSIFLSHSFPFPDCSPHHISNGAPLLLIHLNYTTLTTRFVFCNTKILHSDPKIYFFGLLKFAPLNWFTVFLVLQRGVNHHHHHHHHHRCCHYPFPPGLMWQASSHHEQDYPPTVLRMIGG